jgi:hypothetical protein
MPSNFLTRRDLLRQASFAAVATALPPLRAAKANPSLQSTVESITTISPQPELYHGWPTMTRRTNGQLLLVCSGGREGHVCPFGRVELMRSDDDGHTWTWPQVLLDGPTDDRDAGVLETQQGTLLVTTFTSIAFEERMPSDEVARSGADPVWSLERLARWRAARDRLTADERRQSLGCWIIRSTNGGRTWSEPVDSLVNSPHGPTQLADGRLLYVGRQLWNPPERIGASESTDDGQTWRWLGEIPTTTGDDADNYHELHAVEAADGRIIAVIRNHNAATQGEVLQTESSDGGKTWSDPRRTGVWGYPSHLLRLKDDRLLLTSGHRRPPWGNQASISEDHGRTWSQPLVISGDGVGRDLGYPSSVELDDGTLLTAWYEQLPVNGAEGGSEDQTLGSAVLRLSRWRLGRS